MKRPTLVLFAVFVIGVVFGWVVLRQPDSHLTLFPRGSLNLPAALPVGDAFSNQVDRLIADAAKPEPTLPAPAPADYPPQSPPSVPPSEPAPEVADAPSNVTGSQATGASPPDPLEVDPARAARDRAFLEARNSEIAYVDVGGEISGRKIAVFYWIDSKEKKTVIQGGEINSLRVLDVSDDSVRLGYGIAQPLSKPRIQLDIEDSTEAELSEAEKKARLVRYQELWGNRFLAAARASGADARNPELMEPPTPEQEAARKKYWEQYQEFFEKIRAQDPSVDPRDFPRPDLDPDLAVKNYFETYWPGQYEAETEPVPTEDMAP